MTADGDIDQSTYDLKSVKLPHLTGAPLRLIARLLEGPMARLLRGRLFADAGITAWRAQILTETPTPRPTHLTGRINPDPTPVPVATWPDRPAQPSPFVSVHDYAAA